MPVIVVGAEKSFAALRPRLFAGRVPTAAAREVSAAVRAANPHVDLDALRPGTILTIPDHPKLAVRDGLTLDDATRESVAAVAEAATADLDALVEAARAGMQEGAAERRRTLKALDSNEVASAARRDKLLAQDLERARRGLEAADARAEERAAALAAARKEWAAELAALRELL